MEDINPRDFSLSKFTSNTQFILIVIEPSSFLAFYNSTHKRVFLSSLISGESSELKVAQLCLSSNLDVPYLALVTSTPTLRLLYLKLEAGKFLIQKTSIKVSLLQQPYNIIWDEKHLFFDNKIQIQSFELMEVVYPLRKASLTYTEAASLLPSFNYFCFGAKKKLLYIFEGQSLRIKHLTNSKSEISSEDLGKIVGDVVLACEVCWQKENEDLLCCVSRRGSFIVLRVSISEKIYLQKLDEASDIGFKAQQPKIFSLKNFGAFLVSFDYSIAFVLREIEGKATEESRVEFAAIQLPFETIGVHLTFDGKEIMIFSVDRKLNYTSNTYEMGKISFNLVHSYMIFGDKNIFFSKSLVNEEVKDKKPNEYGSSIFTPYFGPPTPLWNSLESFKESVHTSTYENLLNSNFVHPSDEKNVILETECIFSLSDKDQAKNDPFSSIPEALYQKEREVIYNKILEKDMQSQDMCLEQVSFDPKKHSGTFIENKVNDVEKRSPSPIFKLTVKPGTLALKGITPYPVKHPETSSKENITKLAVSTTQSTSIPVEALKSLLSGFYQRVLKKAEKGLSQNRKQLIKAAYQSFESRRKCSSSISDELSHEMSSLLHFQTKKLCETHLARGIQRIEAVNFAAIKRLQDLVVERGIQSQISTSALEALCQNAGNESALATKTTEISTVLINHEENSDIKNSFYVKNTEKLITQLENDTKTILEALSQIEKRITALVNPSENGIKIEGSFSRLDISHQVIKENVDREASYLKKYNMHEFRKENQKEETRADDSLWENIVQRRI